MAGAATDDRSPPPDSTAPAVAAINCVTISPPALASRAAPVVDCMSRPGHLADERRHVGTRYTLSTPVPILAGRFGLPAYPN